MTADAAVALSSVRREKLIWFSPLPCSCWHHTGPDCRITHRPCQAYCLLSSKIPSVPPSAFMPIDFVRRYRMRPAQDRPMDEGGQAVTTDRGVAIVTGGASGIGLAI